MLKTDDESELERQLCVSNYNFFAIGEQRCEGLS
jgi:hypothetical protein